MKRKREKERQESPKPTGLTSLRLKPQSSIQDENPILAKTSETDAVMEIYEPFLSDGSVSLSDFAQSTNQTIPKAYLQPIPAFDEPFSRIIIDCVGPLPKTKSGCQYLLTIMCASTLFPEAIPLRNIKTKTTVKALVKFFTFVGLPRSVQSDQGSNFMSGIFQQVMHELGIKQYKS